MSEITTPAFGGIPKRSLPRTLLALLGASFTLLLVAVAGVVTGPASPAAALEPGPGYSVDRPDSFGHLGGWYGPGGVIIYCIDFDRDNPWGNYQSGVESGIPGASDDQNRDLNWILAQYGQTSNDNQAAAVQWYVWWRLGQYGSTTTPPDDDAMGPSAEQAIVNLFNQMRTSADNRPSGPQLPGDLAIQASADGMSGTVTVPAGYSQVTLTSATWDATGSSTLVPDPAGGTYAFATIPPSSGTIVTIGVNGTYTVETYGLTPTVTLFNPNDRGEQRLAAAANSGPQSGSKQTAVTVDLVFAPVVGTQVVSAYVPAGDEFCDTVTFSAGTWPTNAAGAPMPVVAHGTLYGPSSTPFVESDAVPVGLPITGTATITNGLPGAPITACTETTAAAPGYYTWVWTITAADQSAEVQDWMPAGYAYSDRFGRLAETHVSPFVVSVSTDAVQPEVLFGGSVSDEVTIAIPENSEWLTGPDGQPVPVTVQVTAYLSEVQPTQSTTVPASAVAIGSDDIVFTGEATIASDAIAVPATGPDGWIVLHACVIAAEPYIPGTTTPFVTPVCDDYGVAAETVPFVAPQLTTAATPSVPVFEEASDLAIISGVTPGANYSLTFELFQQRGDTALCTEDERVFDTIATPVAVTDSGTYRSDVHRFMTPGTYYWVATLWGTDDQGNQVVITADECGMPGESTVATVPTVSTKATPEVTVPDYGHDTAIVEGEITDSQWATTELTFELYRQTGNEVTLCTESNRAWSTEVVPVTVTSAGEYESLAYRFTTVGTYGWVETLTVTDLQTGEKVFVRGECGAEGETTRAVPAGLTTLAFTGIGGTMLLVAGICAIVLAAGLGLTVLGIRRRRINS